MCKTNTGMACRFTLSPMSDSFVDIILGAIGKVDGSAVSQRTDKLSTVYRGSRAAVEDAVKACFLYAYRPHVHMTMECAFSTAPAPEGEDRGAVNGEKLGEFHFPAVGKLTLYPLGTGEVSLWREKVAAEAKERGLCREEAYDGPILAGDVQDIFDCLSAVNGLCREGLEDYTLEFTLSVNSPTPD